MALKNLNIQDSEYIKVFSSELGHYLKELRTSHKLTQYDLALRLDVSNGSIGHWERDLNAIYIDNLIKYSLVFNIPLSTILEEVHKRTKSQLKRLKRC